MAWCHGGNAFCFWERKRWKACNEDLDTVWHFTLSLDTTAYYSESLTQAQSLHQTKSGGLKPEATMDPLLTNWSKRFIGLERQPRHIALDLCISYTHNKTKMAWYRLVSWLMFSWPGALGPWWEMWPGFQCPYPRNMQFGKLLEKPGSKFMTVDYLICTPIISFQRMSF